MRSTQQPPEMAGRERKTVRVVPDSARRTTRQDQDSLYSAMFPPPIPLQQHYANRVGLVGNVNYPDENSFHALPLSRGEQMVKAAQGSSTRTSPPFDVGITFSRRGRSQDIPVYPAYIPTRPTIDKSPPEKRKQKSKKKDEPICVDISDDLPGTSSGKPNQVMDTTQFFSLGKGTFSSTRSLRPRENALSFYGQGSSASPGSSTASSAKRKSSDEDDERKRSDEVLPLSFDDQLSAGGTSSLATGRRRRRSGRLALSSFDEEDEKDDFDWRQIKDDNQYVEYPKESSRRLVVTGRDLKTLMPGHFLNDCIIDFFLKYLETEGLDVEIRSRAYFFSCFFYKRLIERGKREDETDGCSEAARMHDRVKSWTRNTDLFSHDYIVFPVNKGAHWFLVIVCHAEKAFRASMTLNNDSSIPSSSSSSSSTDSIRPCILIFDSLGVRWMAGKCYARNILSYLKEEFKLKKNVKEEAFVVPFLKCLPWFSPKVPLQPNGSDCGIYLLHYTEKFLRFPFTADSDEELKADRSGWFARDEVAGKRGQIRDLILQLGGFT